MVAEIANDPAGYLNNIKTLTSSLDSDPALVGQLVASLPQTIKDEQELENPYSMIARFMRLLPRAGTRDTMQANYS